MDWGDLRYFLAVAREGQMLGAASRLGVSQARLSRHIAALEKAVGTRLFERTTRGSALTGEGEALLTTAEKVEAEILAGAAAFSGQDEFAGTVRIGAPDGFGSAFLAPRLGTLRDVYPNLRIELVPVPRNFSLSNREADLAVVVGRPKKGRLKARKLTDYGLGLYASRRYLDRSAPLESIAALKNHTLVGYVDDLIYSPELYFAREVFPDWHPDVAIATAIGQFEAIAAGIGVGFCHHFMVTGRPDLVRVLPQVEVRRSYWTVWHENQRAAARIRAVADALDCIVRDSRNLFV